MSSALILDVTGQTGAYLARTLVDQGVRVVGTSRVVEESKLMRLTRLGVREKVKAISVDLKSAKSLEEVLSCESPDVIYYLAGPSSVAESYKFPTIAIHDVLEPLLHC